ncbi:uncharacterized protein LOC130795355 [Actinidia eriantha]|uniref:uncharacterized protein LOC130795355 n=1 Tax=Actinidia eriantha TaxID=165200 RepID=UPI00258C7E4C|nr:uncharacterized protein LOC130795355 [Actinidia eriantha]
MTYGGDLVNDNGAYVKLRESELEDCEADGFGGGVGVQQPPSRWCRFWWWARMAVLAIFAAVLAAVVLIWVGPFFMDEVIIPVINWVRRTFSTPMLAVLLFAAVAIFPTFLFPSSPAMWVAGMTFGYGFGFLLIFGGVVIGISLPYFVGSLFYHKIQGWLEKYPKKASIIRLSGQGNWFYQCRDVTLIRISPFPYIIYNYCAVATNVKYGPYLLGSLVGMVPEIFVAIYTGILIRTLADASHGRHSLSAPQIIFNVLGFCATVATTIVVTIYAKRRLKDLHKDEQLLLQ